MVVVAVDHVASSATADVVNGRGAAHFTFELFVETEDGAFAAAVDVAGAATTGSKGGRYARVQTSERRRTGGRARVGGLCVLQIDDIASASPSRMQSRTASVGDRWMRFNEAVVDGRHGAESML